MSECIETKQPLKTMQELNNPFWSYGEYELVGHGKQTNPKCGKFEKNMACLRYDLHNQARFFNDSIPKDIIFVKPILPFMRQSTMPRMFQVRLGSQGSLPNGSTTKRSL